MARERAKEWSDKESWDGRKAPGSIGGGSGGKGLHQGERSLAALRPQTEAGSRVIEADERVSGGCDAAFRSPSSEVEAV